MNRLLSILAFLMALAALVCMYQGVHKEESALPVPVERVVPQHVDTVVVYLLDTLTSVPAEPRVKDIQNPFFEGLVSPKEGSVVEDSLKENRIGFSSHTVPAKHTAKAIWVPDTTGLAREWERIKQQAFAPYEKTEPTFEEYQVVLSQLDQARKRLAGKYSVGRERIRQMCR